MNFNNYLSRLIGLISRHLNHKQQMYIFSLFIGIVSGLAAVLLKNAVHLTHQFVLQKGSLFEINFLYLAFPLLGYC